MVSGGTLPVGAPPRVGGIGALLSAATFLADPIGTTQRIYRTHGPIAELALPLGRSSPTYVFGIGPRYNERVLGDTAAFRTSGIMMRGPRDSAQMRIRTGIVGMNGPEHVHYRKMLLPPLRRPIVDAMVTRMSDVARRNVAAWPVGERIDLWPRVRRLAQDIAISMLFTAEGEGDHSEAHHAADLINEHMRLNGLAAVKGCPIDLPGLPYGTMMRSAERLEAYLRPWALKRRGDTRRDDLLSIIVNSPDEKGGVASDPSIASQILTLFGAAYETCQTVLLWTLFLISQHPTVAGKLLDEIAALPDDGSLLANALNNCVWLDAVVKESMRILPPVPLQMRVATRDADLHGYQVRDGTRMVLSAFLTNRMPDLYPEPDRFLPQRWETLDPDQYEYMVFSAGPRFCPGAWFGATLVKVSVLHVLKALRIEVAAGARIDRHASITLAPRHGLPVVLHRQDRRFRASPVTGDILDLVAP